MATKAEAAIVRCERAEDEITEAHEARRILIVDVSSRGGSLTVELMRRPDAGSLSAGEIGIEIPGGWWNRREALALGRKLVGLFGEADDET